MICMTTGERNHAITANLDRIRLTIAEAAASAGRDASEIKLVAISKNQPIELIAAAAAAGQRIFGENTVQEALLKLAHFRNEAFEWHFIGHLQSNKAKSIPGNFPWLHSLDSLSVAQRLARLASAQHNSLNVLIEVNITHDPAKHGIAPEQLLPFLEACLKSPLPGIALRGLMAIGPYPASEADQRAAFAAVRRLRDKCREQFGLPDFQELSIGMSGDFVPAIKEGATIVRVGTAIFGERDYAKRQ